MPDSPTRPLPPAATEWQASWRHTLDPYRTQRRPTREVSVGTIGIGGHNPVRVQSMTVADTLDTRAVVDEICALHAAGSEIVRVTAPNRSSAENLARIKRELQQRHVHVPLVADIHFTPQAALIAAEHVEKVRINPGNYADRKHFKKWEYSDSEYTEELERLEATFRPLVLRCKELGVAMRIGTNHGSLSDRILNRYGDTPLGMVESALEFVRICEHHGYRDLVLSMKASDVKVMIQAYRLLAARMRDAAMDYPFHLGVTEAGAGLAARVKSVIGIAALLDDGIGDTVRVSLTEDSVRELPVARALAARAASLSTVEPPAIDRLPPWNPGRFERRSFPGLGRGAARLSDEHPPRIELIVEPAATGPVDPAAVVGTADREDAADLILVAPPRDGAVAVWKPILEPIATAAARRAPDTRPALGLEIPATWLGEPALQSLLTAGWSRLSLVVHDEATAAAALDYGAFELPLQLTWVLPDATAQAAERAARTLAAVVENTGRTRPAAVALELGTPRGLSHVLRRFLASWPAPHMPIVLRAPRDLDPAPIDGVTTTGVLDLAAACGALLVDGVGDAVQLHAGSSPDAARRLAAELLQATRLRLSKADFIACPSCGRTQFDLQATTARIEAQLGHLKGLKIAVMGCIVNGPGEMADADFGYVGSGPGRIDLYVRHERVERNVPQQHAVERLIELIRAHGRWIEPPGAQAPPSP